MSPTAALDAAGAAHEPPQPAARVSSDEVVCHAAQLSRTLAHRSTAACGGFIHPPSSAVDGCFSRSGGPHLAHMHSHPTLWVDPWCTATSLVWRTCQTCWAWLTVVSVVSGHLCVERRRSASAPPCVSHKGPSVVHYVLPRAAEAAPWARAFTDEQATTQCATSAAHAWTAASAGWWSLDHGKRERRGAWRR